MAVLRKITVDADFRLQFARDPIWAVTNAEIKLTTDDLTRLEKFTPDSLEQAATAIKVLTGAANASGLAAQAEGTHTLVYAIVVALLLAEQ